MKRPGHTNEKIAARTQELETKLGIGKNDSPLYEKLTPLQWLYTLEVVVEGWVPNKTAYAKEYECARQSLYGYDGNPKVVQAIKNLSHLRNEVRIHNIIDIVYQQAEAGCIRSQKLLSERYPADTDQDANTQPDTSPTWDTSLANLPTSNPTTPEPTTDDKHPN